MSPTREQWAAAADARMRRLADMRGGHYGDPDCDHEYTPRVPFEHRWCIHCGARKDVREDIDDWLKTQRA